MPVWLRKFTFNKVKEYYEAESAQNNKQINAANNAVAKIKHPNINPTYRSKVPSK